MNRILLIGPFPKPISGVALANKVVKEILDKSDDFKADCINTSYPVFEDTVGVFSIKKVLFFLGLNIKAFKIFKNDIIYITPGQTFFGVTKYAFFIILASILNKELIIHVHGNYLGKQYHLLKGFKKKLFYFLISKFTKGIVLSASLKNNLIPFLNDENIFIVNNFAEGYLYKESGRKIVKVLKITYLSNLMEEKGILFLLEALQKLEDKNILYEAKIAGNIDESLKEMIQQKINKLTNTIYLGVVYGKEKKELLEWSNIFVLPTFYKMEGQPISILEALATQNVIIATNHAGIPDIIKTEVNGYIIEPKKSESIFEKLLFLNKNKVKIEEICKTNKKHFIDSFTLEKFSTEIIKTLHAKTTVK
jgi:glycosyltransferase involved in cell wall biosynthesis